MKLRYDGLRGLIHRENADGSRSAYRASNLVGVSANTVSGVFLHFQGDWHAHVYSNSLSAEKCAQVEAFGIAVLVGGLDVPAVEL